MYNVEYSSMVSGSVAHRNKYIETLLTHFKHYSHYIQFVLVTKLIEIQSLIKPIEYKLMQ